MVDKLTDRERTIAELVAQGLHNEQIAATLGIEPRTVKNALWGAYRALGLYQSVNQRVALALMVERGRARDDEG